MADSIAIAERRAGAHDPEGRDARQGGRVRDTGLRRCIVTRAKRPQAEMLRYVVDPDGVVAPDVASRLPGRGVWVTPDRAILTKAIRAGRFKAGFKADVIVPDGLLAETERLLERRLTELFGLARGAGQVGAGWEQARDFARRHAVGLLVVASDAADASRRRLLSLAPGAPVMDALDAATLGGAIGRDHVVNAVVKRGRFAEMMTLEAARRRGLNGGTDDGAAAATLGGEG